MRREIGDAAAASKPQVRLVGSITHLHGDDRGMHVVTGSHGGAFVAEYALAAGVASLIFHDAGVGLDDAGIAALALLDRCSIPAAAVDYRSARIGDAEDMWARGMISFADDAARAAGVVPGMACRNAVQVLHGFMLPAARRRAPMVANEEGHRFRLGKLGARLFGEPVETVCLDSASDVSPGDEGCIVLTGSHGGRPGGDVANSIKARVRLAAFNDAGVGIDDAGIARLEALDQLQIAAFAVSARSARIGDGRSTYQDGVVSRLNATAGALGIEPGIAVKTLLDASPTREGWRHRRQSN